jgi:hypothetical protein
VSKTANRAREWLSTSLRPGERLLFESGGQDGRFEVYLGVTDQRVCVFRMGTTIWSEPSLLEIHLADVKRAECRREAMIGPVLELESRVGSVRMSFRGPGKKAAGELPNMILSAQRALLSTPAGVPPSNVDVASRLAQLAQLHTSGALSDAEFATAKAKLLG